MQALSSSETGHISASRVVPNEEDSPARFPDDSGKRLPARTSRLRAGSRGKSWHRRADYFCRQRRHHAGNTAPENYPGRSQQHAPTPSFANRSADLVFRKWHAPPCRRESRGCSSIAKRTTLPSCGGARRVWRFFRLVPIKRKSAASRASNSAHSSAMAAACCTFRVRPKITLRKIEPLGLQAALPAAHSGHNFARPVDRRERATQRRVVAATQHLAESFDRRDRGSERRDGDGRTKGVLRARQHHRPRSLAATSIRRLRWSDEDRAKLGAHRNAQGDGDHPDDRRPRHFDPASSAAHRPASARAHLHHAGIVSAGLSAGN